MKSKYVYRVRYTFNGVNYEKNCSGFDFGISVPNCLTLYFNGSAGRIVMNADKIENFDARCIWKM